jgi:hypothetical protein
MRFVLKLVVFTVLAPFALLLLLVVAIAAVVGVPLLWERLVARLLAPPQSDQPTT